MDIVHIGKNTVSTDIDSCTSSAPKASAVGIASGAILAKIFVISETTSSVVIEVVKTFSLILETVEMDSSVSIDVVETYVVIEETTGIFSPELRESIISVNLSSNDTFIRLKIVSSVVMTSGRT